MSKLFKTAKKVRSASAVTSTIPGMVLGNPPEDLFGCPPGGVIGHHTQDGRGDPVPALSAFPPVDMNEEMVRLHHQLHALVPDPAHRAIQFIGSYEGEGTSTVVFEFGRVAAMRFGQRVLLLEMDRCAHTRDPHRVGLDGPPVDLTPSRIGDTELFVAQLPRQLSEVSPTSDSRRHAGIWKMVQQDYDLILVDSPPAATSPEGFALVRQVDGVILVLEAEETRWPVAERVKQNIERSGGRVLGVVFNKRRYHIPPSVYRRL